jgi:hypothetical protein
VRNLSHVPDYSWAQTALANTILLAFDQAWLVSHESVRAAIRRRIAVSQDDAARLFHAREYFVAALAGIAIVV